MYKYYLRKGEKKLNELTHKNRCLSESDSQTIHTLLELGVDPNAGYFHSAPLLGLCGMCKNYLSRACKCNYKDRSQLVYALLRSKADMNVQDCMGKTPLNLAARNRQIHIVRLLISLGANPNSRDNGGCAPLFEACGGRLIDSYKGCEARIVNIVELLLRVRADPNLADNDGDTPLFIASWNGNAEVVKMLLEAQADPNILNDYDNSALAYADYARHSQVVKILLEAGAAY
jgi:ankyrin repeat protein